MLSRETPTFSLRSERFFMSCVTLTYLIYPSHFPSLYIFRHFLAETYDHHNFNGFSKFSFMPRNLTPSILAWNTVCFYQGPARVTSLDTTTPTFGLSALCTHSCIPTMALSTYITCITVQVLSPPGMCVIISENPLTCSRVPRSMNT